MVICYNNLNRPRHAPYIVNPHFIDGEQAQRSLVTYQKSYRSNRVGSGIRPKSVWWRSPLSIPPHCLQIHSREEHLNLRLQTSPWVPSAILLLSECFLHLQKCSMAKEMSTHPSILAWWILWMAEPGGLLSIGSHRVGHNWSDLSGNPLQYSRLENPRDREA